jgi:GT2 family glycosyltransferase/glycosyltransferase involved in cell wall biosynthesis
MKMFKAQIICILGMHRSGTSLVSRILNILGVYLGPEAHIMQPGPDNPKGYWEHYMLTALNDEILARLGGSWHEVPVFPAGWEVSSELADLRQRARAILQEDFATADLWGWKDPRTCLTLPFWQRLLPPMRYVICLRNPVDVSRSLERRDNFPFEKGVQLWLAHVTSALRHTTGQPRLFVFYEDLMEDWPTEIKRLANFLGKPELAEEEAIRSAIQEFIEEELQHHRTSLVDAIDEPKFSFPAKALYIVLRAYAMQQKLDFQPAIDLFSSYAVEAAAKQEQLSRLVALLQEQVRERDQAITQLEQERLNMEQHLQAQLAEREQRIEQLEGQIAQLKAEQERLTQELAEKERAVHDLSAQLAKKEQQASILQSQIASLQQRLSWKRYRIADRILGYYWYIRHPKQVWQRAQAHAWELGRRWLPYGAKRLIKRFLLKQTLAIPTNPTAQTPITPISSSETSAFKVPRTSCYDVIYFPIIDWDFRYQRSQHFCSQFALHGHRVFYLKTTFKKIQQSNSNSMIRTIKENVYEVQLPGPDDLNIYYHQISPQVLDAFFEAFQQLRREHSIHEAICIVALPFWRPLVAKLREAFGWKIIYDCMDEHQGFSTNNPTLMLNEETQLIKQSDLVVTTSFKLMQKVREHNPNCLLVPNAADFKHFSAAFGDMPLELKGIPRPIIGYYGAISDWFDTALIGYLARQRPKWNFILIGSTFGADLQPLQGLSNVHLLGEKSYIELPAYLHRFDVCVIPFKLTPLTEATNPVKFFEFLSAGKPVVSVPLPELLPYGKKGLIYIASSPGEFVEQIDRALREDDLERIHARMRFAASQTWEKRFDSLYRAIKALYPKVSIIILTKDNLHLNQLCLDSIYRNTLYPNFEVIIVDNASTDGTREYLQRQMETHQNLRVIFNEENKGFAHANNQGILNALGDYVVLLNNDTVVTRGWLRGLVQYLERDSKVGMVGPITNFAGNEAKIDVLYSSQTAMEEFADRYVFDHEGQSFEIKMLAMFCVAMRRKLIEEVGLLDERFGIGMFEDDDYAYRVKLQGYKLLCVEDVFIHHFGMSTMKKLDEQAYWTLFTNNREKFERKWGIRWEPHKYRKNN